MHTREEKIAAFGRLLDIMDTLREQCPWNAAQTFESIRPLTEEEVYELSDTILKGDRKGTAKELGDLLYHIVFYARIGQEEGAFDIADSHRTAVDLDIVCFYACLCRTARSRRLVISFLSLSRKRQGESKN